MTTYTMTRYRFEDGNLIPCEELQDLSLTHVCEEVAQMDSEDLPDWGIDKYTRDEDGIPTRIGSINAECFDGDVPDYLEDD